MRFKQYEIGRFFDEIFGENGAPRASARTLVNNIEALREGEFLNRQQAAWQPVQKLQRRSMSAEQSAHSGPISAVTDRRYNRAWSF